MKLIRPKQKDIWKTLVFWRILGRKLFTLKEIYMFVPVQLA